MLGDRPSAGAFNYWGYNVQPACDTGYNQWGFWLGVIWMPL